MSPFLRLPGVAVLLAAAAVAPVLAAPAPLEVVRVTPHGEDVPPGRQIVFQFNRPVVPLGRMARQAHEIPVRIQPRVRCQWRWLEPSALACDLPPGDRLVEGTRYSVHMEPGITAEDGATLSGTLHHEFVTQRPAVHWVEFRSWRDPATPVLRVVFNQPVSRSSVRTHVYFEALGEGSARIPVRVGADHEDALAVLAGTATPEQLANAALQASRPARAWLLTPVEALPLDASMALDVEPGVLGPGPEPGIEARATVSFDTFPEFSFLGIGCTDAGSGEATEIAPGSAVEGPGPCDPLASIALLFSAPVRAADAARALSIVPDLAGGRQDYDPWDGAYDHVSLEAPHTRGTRYRVPLPERLKAFHGYRASSAPGVLRDAFGRALESGLDMFFGTAHRRPRMHLEHGTAVLEQGIDSEVPLYVTNLQAIDLAYRRTGSIGTHSRRLEVPPVQDLSFAMPLGVRTLLGGATGAVTGTLQPLPREAGRDRTHFFAQVTPFAVTVKLGHFGSVAWVTRMDDGSPVAGAALTVYRDRLDTLAGPDPGAVGPFITDATGVARLPGTAVLDPQLELLENWGREQPQLFMRVEKDADLGLLPLNDDFRVWTRDAWPHRRSAFGHLKAWGTTAQGIYRAGDTIQYKLYVRHQDNHTLIPAPRDGYALSVIDPTGKPLLDKLAVTLDAFGAFDGELPVPPTAAVGWYRFELHAATGGHTLQAFRVLVSDFTPAPFKVRGDLNADAFEPGARLRVNTTASLHAGGPYTAGAARVTVRVAPRTLVPDHPIARAFRFDTGQSGDWKTIYQDEVALDARGERSLDIELGDPGVQYGELQVESTVSDDRGKRVAATTGARFLARDRYVGLRDTRWLHELGEPMRVEFVVIDGAGVPVEGVAVALRVERQEVFAARVKSAGSAYATRYETRWESVGGCAGRSAAQAEGCEFVPRTPGYYRVTALVEDTHGRQHHSSLLTWVRGAGEVVWEEPEDGALAIVPERTRYSVGDTARYLVRNPFPGATALVTLERYGVLRSWTQRLEGGTPVIEFPVLPDDLPGFHLSVAVLSPRVAAPPPERGQVDLGKPAMRIGYVAVAVDDPYKRLDVSVAAAQPVYRPRDTAHLDFRVHERATGEAAGVPVQLAVAVLDEAVFDLIAGGSRTFDPYEGFYTLDGLDVVSYSLLTRLVGRQKFEKKGASAGGDGGAAPGLRDLFRFVSYWNPSLAVGADGRASVEVPLPDNLTGWRVLAIAATAGDRLGLGQGTFTVNKDTELRPVMPNQVSAGDRFRAGFSVLNRTDSARTLEVDVSAGGDALEHTARQVRSVTLDPFARARVWLDVQTVRPGEVRLSARAADGRDGDALDHRVPVRAPAAPLTAATYGSLDQGTAEQPIRIPADIDPRVGDISLLASPTIIGNADGAFSHVRDYPYGCWEQRLSKGVMASHYSGLREYLAADLEWPGSDALPAQILQDAARFQAPGGGMAFWVPEDARVSPYLSAYTALAFAWLADAGQAPPENVRARLDRYLDRLLRRDVLPDFYSPGMSASVRAVALAALARRGALGGEDVLRYREHLARMSVFGKAMYLDAAWRTLGGAHPVVAEALGALLAHGHESGGKFALAESVDSGGEHLLDTPARANCAALSTLSRIAPDPALGPGVRPLVARLARSVSAARGNRDHWENTQENTFCMAALLDYARAFEPDAPALSLQVSVDDAALGRAQFTSRRDPAVTLSRPLSGADAGQRRVLRIEHQGTGRAYYAARLRYAPARHAAQPVSAGMSLHREYSVQRDGRWQLLSSPMELARGELVRVDLYLSLPAARHFVVVDDAVPGALEPVNRDLATASGVDAQGARFEAAAGSWWHTRDDWQRYGAGFWSFYHRELRHDSVRFFSDYLPAGDYHLSYAAQVIAQGEFSVAPAHGEEMYDPDVFATGVPARLVVAPGTVP